MIGVYAFVPKYQLFPTYIGYSKSIKKRVRQHQANNRPFADSSNHVLYQPFESINDAYICEQNLIQRHSPVWNKTRNDYTPHLFLHECESIDEVFEGYENPPWRRLSMVESTFYHKDRQEWINKGRPRDDR
jgi:predicted GIY-YIG superfamily endonuclease